MFRLAIRSCRGTARSEHEEVFVRKGYADTEVGQVHYREDGGGEPVMLFHHTASSSVTFSRVLPILGKRFRTIAVDSPGFGASDGPSEIPGGMDYYARAMLGVMDSLALDRAHVIGVRTGASIALELAANHPERVDKLALCTALFIETDDDRRYWQEEFSAPKMWEADGRGDFLDDHVLEWVSYFVREDDPEQYLRELIAALQAGPNYWFAYRSVVAHDAYALLPKIRAPLLFVNVPEDNQYDLTKRAHEATARSEYVELPSVNPDKPGWVGFPTQYPEELAAALLDFL